MWGTYKLDNFLLGLADYPAREGTKQFAAAQVVTSCNQELRDKKQKEIEEKINQTFNKIKSCNLEIEINQKDQNPGFIQFTVKKYHRIKVGHTTCDKTETETTMEQQTDDRYEEDERGRHLGWKPRTTTKTKTNIIVYPKVEYAEPDRDSIIGGFVVPGINYIDYKNRELLINKTYNKFTFHVKLEPNKTINDVKEQLRGIGYFILDKSNNPTTEAK